MRLKPFGSRLIVFNLVGMGVSIKLDDVFMMWTAEIYNELPQRMLSAESKIVELMITESRPKFFLGRGEVVP